jgi:hypothetical protein
MKTYEADEFGDSWVERQRFAIQAARGLKALSVRQLWAWLIARGFKDFENRDWRKSNPGRAFRGEFLIHAGLGMTQDEYWMAYAAVGHVETELDTKIDLPEPWELLRGGIIGKARIVDWSDDGRALSLWSGGPGLVIEGAEELPFIPCGGMLGFFTPQLPDPETRWEMKYFPRWKEKGARQREKQAALQLRLKEHLMKFGSAADADKLIERAKRGELSSVDVAIMLDKMDILEGR